ncbi:septation protein SepH [Gryllotalpicola ginsengisoli]|uniref:septation protein SepH n=1 Tax=Gryllotalpicola ginsengisoli TaxID=444608 RepID=UPI0003B640FE|nr:septation protein SepH [Gryllotalpicola ginsengisoli]
MQDLKVIGVESGALLAANDDGERYRIAIDEVLQSKLKQLRVEQQPGGVKISPREIQAHIRGGMSAEDVAQLTGASLEYVQRFEGPIIAEREHIVAQALAVPVRTTSDVDVLGDEVTTFGSVVRERLEALGATGERWASWKEEDGGWVVKLSFTSDDIDHDARWNYDPRKSSLSPANAEATTLSQQGELPQHGLIPRLRAVTPIVSDDAKFDSGQFEFVEPRRPEAVPQLPATGTVKRSDDGEPKDVQNTADLLEALRRRRGEREAAKEDSQPIELDMPPADEPRSGSGEPAPDSGPAPVAANAGGYTRNDTGPLGSRRRGRASMPSWDEIVFGPRGDDDGNNPA